MSNRVLLTFLAATYFAACPRAAAQPKDRLAAPISGQLEVTLPGSRDGRLDRLADGGLLAPSTPVRSLSFRFRPSPAQSAELEQLLQDQQNPSSPRYHEWLTPEQFGERFGLSANDQKKIADWLESRGFHIDYMARSRTGITFSGTAAQVLDAFGTEMHRYRGAGETHVANSSDAQIPEELAPLVYTIRGLTDFREHPAARPKRHLNTSTGSHGLGPGDLAVIYNLKPLYENGITGSGQRIAVVGASQFKMSDLEAFRSKFSLPANDPQLVLVEGDDDPGITDDQDEATLDVDFAGAAAPNASLLYVYGQSVTDAREFVIDQALAPVMSDSYGGCEKDAAKQAGITDLFRSLAQQAAAEGITWVSASGDDGAAGCETQGVDKAGINGITVGLPASIPEVTGVGGTTFQEGSGNYWSSTEGPGRTSAISYIPETAWNDTASDGTLEASTGGSSMFFAKPSWQTGAGVPNDNRRHVPDISFAASWKHDYYSALFNGENWGFGGTSAGTPFFAGIVTLLNQYLVTNGLQSSPGLGNINPRLYELAATTSGVFHDITSGNNIVPCQLGTPDCSTGEYGFSAGPGYDQVTGLGSIDAYNLVTNWAVTAPPPPATQSGSLAMFSEPSILVQNPKPDPACNADHPFYQQLIVQELAGREVELTKFIGANYDMSKDILYWFGSLRIAPYGHASADICWKLNTVPSTIHYEVGGIDDQGHQVSATLEVQAKVAGQPPGQLVLSKHSVVLEANGTGSASQSIDISVPQGETWTISVFGDNHPASWLTLSQKSGKGPGQLNLTASASGLQNGVYTAAVVVESIYQVPSFYELPVIFTVGGSKSTTITAVQNAASFEKSFAPGMIMTVYGTKLARKNQAADSAPLPLSLAGVSATVNGIPAPLYFVSEGQMNLQIPYEVPEGNAILAVNNNGQVAYYLFEVDPTAPGIFNHDGALTPQAAAKRGSTVSIYITGEGELAPLIDTGAPPPPKTPASQLPKPIAPVKVTVGGVEAAVTFAGNPWLVGVLQVNFTVPPNAPVGAQSVLVYVGGVPSAPETLTVK